MMEIAFGTKTNEVTAARRESTRASRVITHGAIDSTTTHRVLSEANALSLDRLKHRRRRRSRNANARYRKTVRHVASIKRTAMSARSRLIARRSHATRASARRLSSATRALLRVNRAWNRIG